VCGWLAGVFCASCGGVPVAGFVGSEEAESGFILGAVVIFWERLSKAVGKNLPLICKW
jgi:hypothetical protein